MQHYIGIKMIEAVPGIKNDQEGYNIIYPDGYASWSPKDVFETSYLPVSHPNSLVAADIDQMMARIQVSDVDSKTTIVHTELVTGFSLYETSSCVSPENYNPQLGTDQCIAKIRSKLWFAMGFILQWAKYGLKNTPVDLKKGDDNNGNPK